MDPPDIVLRLKDVSKTQAECGIYRVHGHLRNINNKAYEPEVIAIGPYHRDKKHLNMMEDHKYRYLHSLVRRKGENVIQYLYDAIKPLELKAWECYAESISLTNSNFVDMLILDGCFIIELVLKHDKIVLRETKDPIFRMGWIVNSLQRDLILFENQIPFFVLCKLFDLIEAPDQHNRLMLLLTSFFRSLYLGKVRRRYDDHNSPHKIDHLLHLVHDDMRYSYDKWFEKDKIIKRSKSCDQLYDEESMRSRCISNATRLREADVKFKRNNKGSFFDIRFKNGIMFIPELTIEDRTESFLRNLIAYEQYSQDTQTNYVTDYVKFIDCLIDCSRDVEILTRFGIIDNGLGDGEVVADMINKLNDSVADSREGYSLYDDIFYKVDKHCKRNRNRWMAKLRRNYLNSPWAIISVIAAVVLLLLTVVQTVFSILQVL